MNKGKMFPRRCLYKMCRGTNVSKNQKRQINRSYNMEELEQQPRKELTFLWELREFKILFKRSTAAALVTRLSQKKPSPNKSQNREIPKYSMTKNTHFPARNNSK